MRVKLASSYGFCFGVKRAIKIAENSPNSSTIGELIHNAKEIDRLKKNFNVKTLKDVSEIGKENRLIIRTHGIVLSDLKRLQNSNKEIIDATCPFVKKPQQIVDEFSKQGYDIVIFGDKEHPEVKSVKSYANGANVFVVLEVEELRDAKFGKRIAVVSQTTKKIENYKKIVNFLMDKSREVRVFNTICNATLQNQDATKNLAKDVDVMIIVGGKNSSNTKQLYLIAKKFCNDSYLIEDESELKLDWFKDKKICGISAGASTPEWIIQSVVAVIKQI